MTPEHAPRRPPTRADVARLAGVSPPVVSYALNGGPKRVSPETRARIEEAVRTLGYRPNASARALRKGRSDALGLIVPELGNPFFAQLAHQVELRAQERGRALLIANWSDSAIDDLAGRQVDGIVIVGMPGADGFAALDRAGVPFALVAQHDPIRGATAIGVDLYQGARAVVDHLVEHGHRSIGFIGEPGGTRRAAWADALVGGGVTGRAAVADYSPEGGYRAVGELFDGEGPRLTAVFASSDQQGFGALHALHERGLDIPGDVAVAAFDGTPLAEHSWPPLTTLEQPMEEMARRAISAVIDPVAAPTEFTRLLGRLIRRASCGCP